MALMKCNSCGGEYQDVSADGVPYFHSCPPVTRCRVKRNGAWIDVELAAVVPTDIVKVKRNGAIVETLVSAIEAADERQGDTKTERADKRDERPATTPGEDENGRLIHRKGKGATRL